MPPLCKGRWQARNEPDGRVVVLASSRLLQPSRLASLGTLPCTGRVGVKCDILLPIRLYSSAKPLLDPQTVRGSLSLEKAEQPSRSAYFHKITLFFAALSEIASEPKANVGFSSPSRKLLLSVQKQFRELSPKCAASKTTLLRSGTQFTHTCAQAERYSGARL